MGTTTKSAKANPKAPPSGQPPGQNLARRDLKNLAAELRGNGQDIRPPVLPVVDLSR